MVTWNNLVDGIDVVGQRGALPPEQIMHVQMDSRKIERGDVFVAVRGTQVNGHDFVAAATAAGARVVVVDTWPSIEEVGVTYLLVSDTSEALGILASNYYGRPSTAMHVVGITGTNGKTTVGTLLFDLYTELGYVVGLLSTVEHRIGKEVLPSTHTTPDALEVQGLLAKMRDAGCSYVFMEVSSHAVVQRRIAGIDFRGAVFTNMSHDHLDYHKTFKAYIFAKKRLFDDLGRDAFALVNIDDKRGSVMVQNTRAVAHSYSLVQGGDFTAKILERSLAGLILRIDGEELHTPLVGDFNAYNLLAVYGAARALGSKKIEVLTALSRLKAARGRMDYVRVEGLSIVGVVDYAHTPDALEKVLRTLEGVVEGKVITVVGCGGNRDKEKRPKMARIAAKGSGRVVFTSDNPRNELPSAILDDMYEGLDITARARALRVEDRREAIRVACQLAELGDVILVAGKGHETYQDIGGVRRSFDDKLELRSALLELCVAKPQ